MPTVAAYGLRIAGLESAGEASRPAPESWPDWKVSQVVDRTDDRPGMSIWDATARIGIPGTGAWHIERGQRRIELRTRAPWSEEALLHPGLSPAAAVVAHWMNRSVVHAAAVVRDGRAWGIMGNRGSGKSTTAALLAELGFQLLTDDLLVVAGETGFAGPGAVDLRTDAARHLGGRPLGRLGGRERWRKAFPLGPLEAPVEGWVVLEPTGGAQRCDALPPAERLAVLSRHCSLPQYGRQLLLLADRPMLRFDLGSRRAGALAQVGGLAAAIDRLAASRVSDGNRTPRRSSPCGRAGSHRPEAPTGG